MIVYLPKAKMGERVKLLQPETSHSLPDGLRAGDEAIVTGEWDHSYYRVTKDGNEYQVSHMCIDMPVLQWPPKRGDPSAL